MDAGMGSDRSRGSWSRRVVDRPRAAAAALRERARSSTSRLEAFDEGPEGADRPRGHEGAVSGAVNEGSPQKLARTAGADASGPDGRSGPHRDETYAPPLVGP